MNKIVEIRRTGTAILTDQVNNQTIMIELGGVSVATATASQITYSNTTSGLAATDVQAAIDEIEGRLDTVETSKLDKAGGTLTGPLTLAGDPSNPLEAATKQYVDSQSGSSTTASSVTYSNTTSGLAATDVQAAIDELDTIKLDKTGGTMTGDLTLSKTSPLVKLLDATNEARFILSAGIGYLQAAKIYLSGISSVDLTELKARFAGAWQDIIHSGLKATQAEAEGLTDDTKYMTPLKTSQAIIKKWGNKTISTSTPTGGSDGDVWFQV